jgi:AcrR family transcriptional regulator
MTGPQLGRAAIIDAAITLFAERGVDGVSLGDIHRASGHRNRSATAYHFGTKDDLVKAVITGIVEAHDAHRVEELDALDTRPDPPNVREVVRASLTPLVTELADRPGRTRLRTLANVIADHRYMAMTQDLMQTLPGLTRTTSHIYSLMGAVPEELRAERVVLATSFGLRAFADQARLIDTDRPPRSRLDDATFAAHVPVLIEALLLAPPP